MRVPELDAVRGLGALIILGFHLWPVTFFFGWTRADLFFVISGYLITRIIFQHGTGRGFLFRFWARRALRTWPAYYLMLMILLTTSYMDGDPPPIDGLVAHVTFTQNLPFYWSPMVPAFSHAAIQSWSLAIEEQFYLVWPLLAMLCGRSVLIPAAVWLIVTSVVIRLDGVYPAVALARADGLALGAILAAIVHRRPAGLPVRSQGIHIGVMKQVGLKLFFPRCFDSVRARYNTAFVLTGVIGVCFVSGPLPRFEEPIPGISGCGAWSILGVNIIYFSLIGLVVVNTGHRFLAPMRWRPLCYLGSVSYGIYLYNLLVIEMVQRYIGYRSLATDLAGAALSILAGVISWEILEKPICKLKHRCGYQNLDSRFEIPVSKPPAKDSNSHVADPERRTPGSVCYQNEVSA